MARYSYSYLLEYIPVRFTGLSTKQLKDRMDVYNFKDGSTPPAIKSGLLTKIRNIISGNPLQWVVCFIPASTRARTYNRFSSLALHFSREAGCDVYIDAIVNTVDTPSGYISGKRTDPTQYLQVKEEYIRGKKVILIDDVITRGRTFDDTADKLLQRGATYVEGLFVAKTIHPSLPVVSESDLSYGMDYDIYEEIREEELAAVAGEEMCQNEILEELWADQVFETETAAECMDYYEEDYRQFDKLL